MAGLTIKPSSQKELTQEQALANLEWLDKAKAFYLVPNALKNGVLLGKLPTQNGKISAFIIAAPVSISDKVYSLLMEVRSDENMQRLYVHEAVLREDNAPLDEFKTAAASQKEAEPHSPPRGAIVKEN